MFFFCCCLLGSVTYCWDLAPEHLAAHRADPPPRSRQASCLFALGSDTGGSIRQPAACTGIAGMKPTYGRVSRYGLVAFASSLDQIGTFTRSAADSATALEVLCGHDPHDSTSLPEPVPQYSQRLSGEISGLVIGLPREYLVEEGVDPAVLQCVREAVAELGAFRRRRARFPFPTRSTRLRPTT